MGVERSIDGGGDGIKNGVVLAAESLRTIAEGDCVGSQVLVISHQFHIFPPDWSQLEM